MITYQREHGIGSLAEAMPLLLQHWREVEPYSDIPPDPNVAMLKIADDAGLIRIYTARDEGKLVGYVAFVLGVHVHYRTRKYANQDALFVLPEYRGMCSIALLRFADEQLAADGVHVVVQNEKVSHPFGPLLRWLGYTHEENVWTKRLDRIAA